MPVRLALVSFLVLATAAGAVELRSIDVRVGTDGLISVPLSVSNAASVPMVCIGELAHWYSAELARAAAGETALVELWFDPQSGTYTVLNDKRENMPVEALWCGLAGRSYETRGQILLERRPGKAPTALALTCTVRDGRLDCR